MKNVGAFVTKVHILCKTGLMPTQELKLYSLPEVLYLKKMLSTYIAIIKIFAPIYSADFDFF